MTDGRSSRPEGEPVIIELLPMIVIVGYVLDTWSAVSQSEDWGDLFSPIFVAVAVTLVIVGVLRLVYTAFRTGR